VHKHLLHVVSQKQNKCRKKPKVKNTTDKHNKKLIQIPAAWTKLNPKIKGKKKRNAGKQNKSK